MAHMKPMTVALTFGCAFILALSIPIGVTGCKDKNPPETTSLNEVVATAGAIRTAARVWLSTHGGTFGATVPTMTDLGFGANDLDGDYALQSDYAFTPSPNSAKFTIEFTNASGKIAGRRKYKIDQDDKETTGGDYWTRDNCVWPGLTSDDTADGTKKPPQLTQKSLPKSKLVIDSLRKVKAGFTVGISFRDYQSLRQEMLLVQEDLQKSKEWKTVPRQIRDSIEAACLDCSTLSVVWKWELTGEFRYSAEFTPSRYPEIFRRYPGLLTKAQSSATSALPEDRWVYVSEARQIVLEAVVVSVAEADRLFRELPE